MADATIIRIGYPRGDLRMNRPRPVPLGPWHVALAVVLVAGWLLVRWVAFPLISTLMDLIAP